MRDAIRRLEGEQYIFIQRGGGPAGQTRYRFNLKKLNANETPDTSGTARPPADSRRNPRQGTAAKLTNELTNKGAKKTEGGFRHAGTRTRDHKADATRAINARKQCIENQLSTALGDGGYVTLMNLDPEVVGDLIDRVLRKEIPLQKAADAIRHGYGALDE